MAVINLPKTGCGVLLTTANRKFAVQAPVACWISFSSNPAGDATASHVYARINGGMVYVFTSIAPDVYLSGQSTDPNADVTPTPLTFIDSGTAIPP